MSLSGVVEWVLGCYKELEFSGHAGQELDWGTGFLRQLGHVDDHPMNLVPGEPKAKS